MLVMPSSHREVVWSHISPAAQSRPVFLRHFGPSRIGNYLGSQILRREIWETYKPSSRAEDSIDFFSLSIWFFIPTFDLTLVFANGEIIR